MDVKKLGKNIKHLRELKGYKQAEFAEMVGVEPTTLSYYESGKRIPSLPKLVKIAELLKVPVSMLIGDMDSLPSDVVARLKKCAELEQKLKKIREILDK